MSWSINSRGGSAVISSPTQSSVTINGFNIGYVKLIATVSNQCLQTRVIEKNIWIGVPLVSSITVLDMSTFTQTIPFIEPSSPSDCPTIGLELNLLQPDSQILEIQWERITQNAFWNRDFSSTGTNEKRIFIYPNGNRIFDYRVRLRNVCGWSTWFPFNHNITNCSYEYTPPFSGISGSNFTLNPVPVTNNTLQLGLTNDAPWFLTSGGGGNGNPFLDPGGSYVPASVIVNIIIYNQAGGVEQNLPNTTIPSTLNLTTLMAGTYIIVFEYQGQLEAHTIIKN